MANPNPTPPDSVDLEADDSDTSPACVMTFNANDPSGAAGLTADIAAIVSAGAHPLAVVTGAYVRDTAEIFNHFAFDDEVVSDQARSALEDMPISAIKVGFVGSPENISAIAEIASDYAEIPLIAKAASDLGVPYTLVTGIPLPDQFIDNVLATPLAVLYSEKFERFEAVFQGTGETLSAALCALLANGHDLQAATSEALTYLDHSLNAGFHPGMGHIIPDRLFWAQAEDDDDDDLVGEGRITDDAALTSSLPFELPPNGTTKH